MASAPFTGMGFVSVHVRDIEKARRFYGQVLGMKEVFHDPGWKAAGYQVPGMPAPLGIHQMDGGFCAQRPGRPPGTPSGVCFLVPDVGKAVADLQGRGVAITEAPFEANGKPWAVFADPDGNEFVLSSP